MTVDQKWETWYERTINAIEKNIPKRTLGKLTTPQWIDLECMRLKRKMNRALSKAKKSKSQETEKNIQ